MNILNLALMQTNIHWEDKKANLSVYENMFDSLKGKDIDMFILPETFHTGFSMEVKALAEGMDGLGMNWLKGQAADFQAMICTSLIINEEDRYYNRFCMVYPDGKIITYDKRHLFRMGGEHKFYQSGNKQVISDYKSWRIMPQVCYDLRFPVWSRNKNNYDLLIYVANWPAARREVWKCLLQARAIENQAYVVGVNRIGSDANGHYHAGESMVFDARGQCLLDLGEGMEQVKTLEIDLDNLFSFREKFPAYKDQDSFSLGI